MPEKATTVYWEGKHWI